MTYSKDLLDSARRLIGGARSRPRHSDCNRAVSTAYYAVFDHLCRTVANKVVGPVSKYALPGKTWVKVYRSIEHKSAQSALKPYLESSAQTDLTRFATQFVTLQNARHEADYNQARHYNKSEVENLIVAAASAINHLDAISKDDLADLIVALILPKPKR